MSIDWRFIMQSTVSLIVLGFGIAIFFSTDDNTLRIVGTTLVTTVLGLWMKGVSKFKISTEEEMV